VEFAGVERLLDTPVKRYSSGMYVRLAFSVAAHLEPDILVVDEVLAVGDAEFQKKCLGKMEQVTQGAGRTVLFVSHNLEAIKQLCTRVIWLDKGKVVRAGKDVIGIVEEYLVGQKLFSSNAHWENNEKIFINPYFTPLEFALTDSLGKTLTGAIKKSEEIFVKICADIKELDKDLIFGYVLYDELGSVLCWSLQTDTPEQQWPKINLGKQVFAGRLPLDVLNEGRYSLELIAGLYYRGWFISPGSNKITLGLEINGGLSPSPFWANRRPGTLAVVMPWEVKSQIS
jgi:lipopolysaccharide transport system ATP-binding protein